MEKKYLEIKKEYLNKNLDLSDIDFAFCNLFNKKRYELNSLVLKDDEILKIEKILKRLENKEPLSNIFKSSNFYGRDFFVNNWVLTPRFETEELVYHALRIIKEENLNSVLDLCCGSGCIGITLKLENKDLNVSLSDISEFALSIARNNSRKLDSRVTFIKSDLLENIKDDFDLIISNPPYIKKEDKQILDIQVLDYDPHISLFGGDDGLDYYREIKKQTKNFKKLKYMLFEFGINQKEALEEIFKEFDTTFIKDINDINRILVVKR